MKNGIPISGDFNGDGKFEIGVFKDGFWFIDLNDNGVWDAGDLWAKLGHQGDRPVTGDWDGDGKTDIGIYGPAWSGDPRAIAHEPGLPDPHNPNHRPAQEHSPSARASRDRQSHAEADRRRQAAQRLDRPRVPLRHAGRPSAGGRLERRRHSHHRRLPRRHVAARHRRRRQAQRRRPVRASFGHHGDMPLSGDFDGDGIDEIAVYRDGMWYHRHATTMA